MTDQTPDAPEMEDVVTFSADLDDSGTHVEVTVRCSVGGDRFEAVRASLSLVTTQSVASTLQQMDPLRLYSILGAAGWDGPEGSDDEDDR